jgi:diguanylate cyclase (GGDEF)-like protein
MRLDIASSVGALFFLAGGVAAFGGLVIPHPPHFDVVGYLVLGVSMIAAGVVVLILPSRWRDHAPPLLVTLGVAFVTFSIYFNGERAGGDPLMNEFFYVWPAFYIGYFAQPRGIVAGLAWNAAAYATVLYAIEVPLDEAANRILVTMSALSGIAVAARGLRRHVDQLVERLDTLARTDPLTGLLNRRAFDERIADELARTRRTGTPFVLLLGDIDHFKGINDRLGHAAGDAALAHVASVLVDQSRGIDTVARVGGEEFALLLPGADLGDGVQAAKRLLDAVRRSRCNGERLTMSFGVAEGTRHGQTADDLLRVADRALYLAKQRGRDRAVAPDEAAVAAP